MRQVGQYIRPDVLPFEVGGQALPGGSERLDRFRWAAPSSGQTGPRPSTFRLASTRPFSVGLGYIIVPVSCQIPGVP